MELSLSTALAFAVTAVLTLTLRPLALRLGITDKPGGRKQHIGEIPLIGGIAMFIGILVAAMTTVQTTGLWTLLVPAALLVVVGVIDGLAASMALIGLAAAGLATGVSAPAVSVAAVACGATLGFLLFNFPAFRNRRLRTFMGDAGSTLLGFVVVWFALSISQGADRSMSPVAALWFALMPLSDFFSCVVRRVARGKMPLHAGREHFHYVLMRAGLSGRQVLAVLLAFSVLYSAVGLIGVRQKLPDWPLFAPWFTLLASQSFIIRGLAERLRHRRWRASSIVVRMPAAVAATHSYATQPRLAASQRNGQGLSGAGIQPQHDEAPLQPLGDSARPIEAHAPERGRTPACRGGSE